MHKPVPESLAEIADSMLEGPVRRPHPRRPLPPWLAEIEERLRSGPSLWDTLTEEDREFLRTCEGPELLGPPPPPPMKRRPRGRGER